LSSVEITFTLDGQILAKQMYTQQNYNSYGIYQWGTSSGTWAPAVPPFPDSRELLGDSESCEPLREISGSVVGYRGWRLNCVTWQLQGTGVAATWMAGVNEAKCDSGLIGIYPRTHPAPHPGCHCGIYGLSRFDPKTNWWKDDPILGAIEAWADDDLFFLHKTGFRAQYAKIVLLATSKDYPKARNAAIRGLAEDYDCGTCDLGFLEDAAKEHGQLVPDDLLAWAGT
jgi:hypothetical protein